MEKLFYHIFAYALVSTIILHPSLAKSMPKTLASDQSTLLSLKSHITFDPSHILATNWTNSSNPCSWIGVTCNLHHQRVASLNLSSMNLLGTVPPQLGRLSFLVSLNLSGNLLSGALPQELSHLRRLKFISLRFNNFSGHIPPLFGQLPKLEYLNLRNNSFIGSVPRFLSNLTNLGFLDLSYNSLSGEIPQELGRLENLQTLVMASNHLFGVIPSSIFNISKLVVLSLWINDLEGGLPTEMCSGTDFPFLREVNLSYNQLQGAIPANLSRCSRLRILALSYNSLDGPVPAEIGYLTSLERLALGGNKLNGMLPQEIGNLQRLTGFGFEDNQIGGFVDFNIFMNMSSLQILVAWRNKLMGKLSRNVANITTLTTFDFSENYFTGIIPPEFGQLYQLEQLLLETNTLTGSIPHEFFNISTLQILSFFNNNLSGVLPSQLCHGSPILEKLYISKNSVTGPLPNSISNCSQLKILALGDARLSGYIPTDLGNLRLLERLELFSNNFSNAPSSSSPELSFITSLTNCKFLTALSVGDNPLYGTIPLSVGNLSSSLQQFYAYGCKLSGNIPLEIGNLSKLIILSLYENEFSGSIPFTIKQMVDLQGLFLDANMLRGSISEAICGLHSLSGIYITQNQFSGPIPTCLGNISSLRDIYLNSNMLDSSIPTSLWGLKDLINLDLSSNSLHGVLPQELGNLGAAIYINLSMNLLSESIPTTIGKLQNLVVFSLANNMLGGSIPMSVGSMVGLVTLDLSYNNLSGSIPKSLEKLEHLQYFNVSFNTLSGEIPNDGSFINFTMDSFKGNEALCGNPRFGHRACPNVSKHGSKRKKVERTLFITLGAVALITVVSLAFIIVRYKRKDKPTRQGEDLMQIVPERISYYELLQATEQFSGSNLIGTGSSSSVYKGILSNGKVIAAKVFNLQLEGISRRFDVECEILRNIRHRNLTGVISSCSNDEFKALVLEYMPKGSLEKWLYSQNHCSSVMERLNIIIDVASALEYLHHGYSTPVVHSDLKPSNVLLDEDMIAHVSDFGIAKLLGHEDTFVVTETLATLGYIAPEYGSEGLVSTRCDVYSYGVMVMEIFTRKRPSDDMFCGDISLKSWVQNSVIDEVIDAKLVVNLNGEELDKNLECVSSILELAFKCSFDSAEERINIKEAHTQLHRIKRRFVQGT